MKKRFIAAIATTVMAVSLFGCGQAGTTDASTQSEAQAASQDGAVTYKIGLCNYVADASLDQICDNIKSTLEEIGKDNNVIFEIEYDNCNADANVLNQIIANFVADDVDLMIGVATPVAMSMQAADSDIPIIFSAVTDPVAAGLVESLEAPGAKITGTSDYLDTDAVMNLIFAADPSAQKIGLLYDAGQDSSTTPIADAKAYLDAKGIEYVERTGTGVDEVTLAAEALVTDGVDAVFTPQDNTIMQAELSIYETLANAGIPHYTGADSFALNGAFLGYGVDYANLGVETAYMVKDVLLDGKDTATLAVKTFDNGTATVNTETCSALGFNFEDIKETFAPYCTSVNEITTAESFN
ncbi:MAG: ABC transporter substrate-binding protein [Butyrivibrio sp.]|nr:ABC transporter substrate-binding protein [Butyrivibrio sp.]